MELSGGALSYARTPEGRHLFVFSRSIFGSRRPWSGDLQLGWPESTPKTHTDSRMALRSCFDCWVDAVFEGLSMAELRKAWKIGFKSCRTCASELLRTSFSSLNIFKPLNMGEIH